MTFNFYPIIHFIKHFFSAKRNGHGIHSPFGYKLCEEVFYNRHPFYDFKYLNSLRQQLLNNEQVLEIKDLGAGSKTFKTNTRKIKDIAMRGISSRRQSEILYKLINFLKCETSLELGTSLGLTALYLAKANAKGTVFTVEGSESLFQFATDIAKKNNAENIRFIHSSFNNALPDILNKIDRLDFLYVDGNHAYAPTLDYFKMALAKRSSSSVFIFDDIYWSKDMTKAWNEIKDHPAVTMTIDTFNFGMVFFREEIKEKVDLRLYI